MSENWLSLSQAAELLGVHPGTVRTWADQGSLPAQRTQGGHRRFRRADVEQWQRLRNEHAIPETQHRVLRHAAHHPPADRRRSPGEPGLVPQAGRRGAPAVPPERSLAGAGAGRLISAATGEGMEAEARSLGYEYASRGQRCGLNCVEAAHAFQFFRSAVMESVLNAYETAGVRSPQAWTDMVRKMITFSDLIMLTLLGDLRSAAARNAMKQIQSEFSAFRLDEMAGAVPAGADPARAGREPGDRHPLRDWSHPGLAGLPQ